MADIYPISGYVKIKTGPTGSVYKTHKISSSIDHFLTEALLLTLILYTLPWEMFCEMNGLHYNFILYIFVIFYCCFSAGIEWSTTLKHTKMCGSCGEWDVLGDCIPLLSHSTGIVWMCERMCLPFHFDLVLQFHLFRLQWYRIKVNWNDFGWRNDRYLQKCIVVWIQKLLTV